MSSGTHCTIRTRKVAIPLIVKTAIIIHIRSFVVGCIKWMSLMKLMLTDSLINIGSMTDTTSAPFSHLIVSARSLGDK